MNETIPINLAVEDELTERIARRALSTRSVRYALRTVYARGGFGYLKKQAPAFNNAAKACPFLLITDLDKKPCPSHLISEWLTVPKHPHFLLRVAVREAEGWLLGDSVGFSSFLGLRTTHDFEHPENLSDPKQELLKLASKSPRRFLREALTWSDKTTGRLSQGPDYNAPLAKFVADEWNIDVARNKCASLNRLFLALDRLESDYRGNKNN